MPSTAASGARQACAETGGRTFGNRIPPRTSGCALGGRRTTGCQDTHLVEIESLVQVTNVSHPADRADNDPLQNVFAAAGEERVRYNAFLAALRESHPVFAEACPLNNRAAPVERRTWGVRSSPAGRRRAPRE